MVVPLTISGWFIKNPIKPNWLVVSTPLKNMSSSIGMMKSPKKWENKTCSSHHQPANIWVNLHYPMVFLWFSYGFPGRSPTFRRTSHLEVHVATGSEAMCHLRQQSDATAHDAHQEDVRPLRFKGDPEKRCTENSTRKARLRAKKGHET